MWFIKGKRQVIELKRSAQEKRARQMVTRPEPTIIWQLRWLELHCRQKGREGKSAREGSEGVAGLQRAFYTQLIHKTLSTSGITCGHTVDHL
ncbi:hypothetical protein AVME950_12275 [Acidovorax sp. SUPP950]|uniref:hypothetical protein n=1 Tax=Acidovorax sp. SUPP950 TaxID=511901 RepID=UPI0023D31D02|nr:hypothetical protein [Acidovorax sp. SUPP950]GKS75673.1 hypothetical protein AVME950_12275 [Acidovorax sp. SUPP950]